MLLLQIFRVEIVSIFSVKTEIDEGKNVFYLVEHFNNAWKDSVRIYKMAVIQQAVI